MLETNMSVSGSFDHSFQSMIYLNSYSQPYLKAKEIKNRLLLAFSSESFNIEIIKITFRINPGCKFRNVLFQSKSHLNLSPFFVKLFIKLLLINLLFVIKGFISFFTCSNSNGLFYWNNKYSPIAAFTSICRF